MEGECTYGCKFFGFLLVIVIFDDNSRGATEALN